MRQEASMTSTGHDHAATLRRGRQALAEGAWTEAVSALGGFVEHVPSHGAAWEALGNACMWVQDTERAIDARQRAYALYREQGDDAGSARVCLDLVWDYMEVRGESAIANGWFQRARRLLDALPSCAEHALLGVFDAYMSLDDDPAAAADHAREAVRLAGQVGADDIGTLALGLHGLALVTEGRSAEGMCLLDEAIAGVIGRDVTDPQWFYFTCCCMIDACDRVRDFDRSMEWCDRLREFAERWQVRAFLTSCRIKYTGALLWRGEWDRFEDELQRAIRELGAERPSLAAGAVVRLAELRRRQGDAPEAERLLDTVASHPLSAAVRLGLAADAGDAAGVLDMTRSLLRQTPASARTERVYALEQQARSAMLLGRPDEAHAAAAQLGELAEAVRTPALRASAQVAAACVATLDARHDRAADLLTDAVHLLEQAGSAHEAATVRIDLANSLHADGRTERARAELERALRVLEPLGAAVQAGRARATLAALPRAAAPAHVEGAVRTQAPPAEVSLTPRQSEVLSLVADGLSDREIAGRLCLSEHTVHRHVSNIFLRLGVSTRPAAVARALRGRML
jgi:LuxR family transcriptional regulator, maltose regulon positive regulatory protein